MLKRLSALVLLVSVLGFSGVGCGGKLPAVTVPNVPGVSLGALATTAVQAERAGTLVVEAQRAEIGMHQMGWVTRETHVTIQRSLLVLATSVDELLATAQTLTTEQTMAQLMTRVEAAIARFQTDVDAVPNANVRGVLAAIGNIVRMALAILPRAAPPALSPEAMSVLELWAPLAAAATY